MSAAVDPAERLRTVFGEAKSREFAGHSKKVHSVGWNVKGNRLASGSVDQTARVWNVEHVRPIPHTRHSSQTARAHTELHGHTSSVEQLVWDPNHADLLATASNDKTIRVWDVRAARAVHVVSTHGENINIAWSPNGQSIAVGNKDDVVSIVDTRKFRVSKVNKYRFEVNEFQWTRQQDRFLLSTGTGSIEVLKDPTMELICSLSVQTANLFCVDVDPLDRYFATGGADALVSLWDLKDLVCVGPVRTLGFSHDGEFIASASEDMAIDIVRLRVARSRTQAHVPSGRHVFSVPTVAPVNHLAWNPKAHLLAYASDVKDVNGRSEGVVHVFGLPEDA